MKNVLRPALLVIPALLMAVPELSAAKSRKTGYDTEIRKEKSKSKRKSKRGESAFVSQPAPTFSPALTAVPPASGGAMIMAYKRDPVPVFDASGSKLRDVPKNKMPKVNTVSARVLGTKPGYVQIMLDGAPAWLRLTAVDYVGTVSAPPCEKVVTKFAKMEEDGVERSLGLGCKK